MKLTPARSTGLARGLTVVEGEGSAAARARALRARGAPAGEVVPPLDVVDAETGATRRVVRRPPRYSPEMTAEQAMRGEAMARHAGATEDPRDWFAEPAGPSREATLQALREKADSFGWSKRAADTWYRRMAAEYEASKTPLAEPLPEGSSIADLLRSKVGLPPMKRTPSKLLDAFEQQYGWRPETEEHARQMLSPQALQDLGFPETE